MGFFSNLFEPRKKEPAITGRTEDINTLFGFVEDAPSVAPRRRQAAPEPTFGPGSFLQETFTATGPKTREESLSNIRKNLLREEFTPKELRKLPLDRPTNKFQNDFEGAILTSQITSPKEATLIERTEDAFQFAVENTIKKPLGIVGEAAGETVVRPVSNLTAGFLDTARTAITASEVFGVPEFKSGKEGLASLRDVFRAEDPNFLDQVGEAFGSTLFFMLPGGAVGKGLGVFAKVSPLAARVGASTFSGFMEGGIEAGSVYDELIQGGASETEARLAGLRTLAVNGVVNSVTNSISFFGDDVAGKGVKRVLKKALRGMSTESLQEVWQQMWSNFELERPIMENVPHAGVIGGIVGGVLGPSGLDSIARKEGTVGPPQSPRNLVDTAVADGKEAAVQEVRVMKQEGLIKENRLAGLFGGQEGAARVGRDVEFSSLVDKVARFEIDDTRANISQDAKNLVMAGKTVQLSEILQHDELFQIYPQLKAVKVAADPSTKFDAQFRPKTNTIALGQGGRNTLIKGDLLHEAQHLIQNIEGFAKGGSTSMFKKTVKDFKANGEVNPDSPVGKYLRLAGEVEARDVEARLSKVAKQEPPLASQEVSLEDILLPPKEGGVVSKETGKPKKVKGEKAESAIPILIPPQKEKGGKKKDELSPADKAAAKKFEEGLPKDVKEKQEKGGVLNNIITKFAERKASEQKGQFILDELSNKGVSPQELNDKFWKNTYDSVSPDIQKKIQGMLKSEIGFEPGDVMGVDKKGGKIIAQNWKDVGLVMDVGDNAALLEGTERGYVSIIAEASARFSKDVVEKKPVVQPKSKEEILKLVTPTKDLTLSPADKAAAKKFEETLPKEVKEKLDATRKSRQRPAQLATLKDLKDLEKDMVRAGAAKEQIAEVRKQINNVRANLEPSIKAVRREVTTQRKRAETAERRIKALTKKLQKLPPSKRLELGIEVSPTLLPEPKSQLKESIQKEIKDQEDAQGTFIQYEENIAPIGDRADIDVRVAMPEVLDAAPKLKDISSLRAGFSDLFRNFQRVFKGDLFKVANNKILRPFKESKRNNVEFQEKILKDLKENVVDKLGIRKKSKESKAVQQWGEGLRSRESLVAEFGEKGAKKIEKADDWFRKKYDDLLDEMNTVRKRIYPKNPEKLVLRRADYYRHFRELSDGLSSLGRALATNAAISPELAGISEFTKPKSKFLSLAMPRFGFKTKVDAVGGFLNYLPAASYAIHIDPHTQVFRALGKNLADATQETKNLNNFIEFLHDFSNDLAGKTNPMDRAITKWFPGGRKGIRVLEWVNNRVKANIILGNLSSSVAQLFNIPLGIARAGITNSVRGVQMTMAQVVRLSNIQKQSPFIKERYFRTSYDKFDRGMLKSTKKFAVWTTRVLDEAGTKFIWNASYSKGIQDKVTNPIEFADEMTRRAVAGRGIGELPLAQKSIVTQIVAPFQVEVGNANLEILDILGEKKFGQFATLIIVSYLMNSVAEVLRGSRVVYDPIDAVVDGLMSNDDDEGVIERISKFTGRQIGEILSNVPFGQTLAALYPEYGMQIAGKSMPSRRGLFGEGDPTRFGGGLLIAGSISDPIFKLLLPFGGVQLQKTIKGGRALLEKEVRSKSGKSRLFKVEDDITSVFQALAFGPYSLPESREYFGNETLLDLFFPKPKKAKGLKKIKAGFKGFKGIKTGFKD